MMKGKTFCTKCFKTLGVPSRMEIYKYLQDVGKATVGDVVEHVGLTQPTVSYHLGEMKKSCMVSSEKKGKEVYYSLNFSCPHTDEDCILKNVNFHQAHHA